MPAHDHAAILSEPAPCDGCRYASLCGTTGAACKAFAAYVQNERWKNQRRQPDLNIGRRLGLVSEKHLAQLRKEMQGFVTGR